MYHQPSSEKRFLSATQAQMVATKVKKIYKCTQSVGYINSFNAR
jgi:hypothetical protein